MRLHKEHGLNPTIPVCFFCGEEKEQIALLGDSCKTEAPRNAVLNYEPCEQCSLLWKQGTAILEADITPFAEGQPPLPGQDLTVYLSGRYLVVRKNALLDGTKSIVLMLKEDFCKLYDNYKTTTTE